MAAPRTSRNPVSIQNGAYGSVNPLAVGTKRPVPAPFTLARPPVQGVEQFTDIPDENTSRALNQLQENIRSATAQSKSNPFADCNLLVNVTLTAGGASGADPMVLSHGLGRALQGFQIQSSTKGGSVLKSALIPNPNPDEDSSLFRCWVELVVFEEGGSVIADILVY